jgi:O-antigen/teichoic acid export membrane protein
MKGSRSKTTDGVKAPWYGDQRSRRTTADPRRVLILTVIDQGASSLSNFALSIVVAHYSGPRELGIFALLTTTYILTQGFVRSFTSDCLLTRSETDDDVMRTYEGGGYLLAFFIATILSIALLFACGLMSTAFGLPFLVFAVSFPLMALQDYSRYIGISRHNPGYSIRLDTAWVILFIGAFAVLRSTDHVSLPWLIGAWTGAGALVGLTTLRSHLVVHSARTMLRFWIESERAVGVRFASQFMLITSWTYFIFYLLVFVVSIDAVGQIKLAQLALGPVVVMAAGVQSALVSLASKKFRVDPRSAERFLFSIGCVMAAVTALWTALMFYLPVHSMAKLLGPTWPEARMVVPFMGLSFVLASFSGVANSGLRAMRAAKENLRLAIVMLPFVFVPCLGGAALWGARGFAAGLSVAQGIYAMLGWIVMNRTARHFDPDAVRAPETEATLQAPGAEV